MTKFTLPVASTAVLLFMPATTAFADVTASQVWDDMKEYMQDFGYEVSATEEANGDMLVVSDTNLSMTLPDDAGKFDISTGTMTFTNNGDGTVGITFPNTIPINFNIEIEGDPVSGRIDYTHTGLVMTISGEPDNMTYTYAASSLGMNLAELSVEGEVAPPGMIKAMVNMSDISGLSTMAKGNLRTISQTINIGAMDYLLDVAPPEEGKLSAKGGTGAMSFSGTTAMPFEMDMNDMASAIKAGFAVDGTFEYVDGNSDFLFKEDGETVTGSSSTSAGSFGVTMNVDRLRYSLSSDNMKVFFQGGDIPFPVNLEMARSLFDLAMPLSKSDDVQDFSLAMTLGGFEMSDILWSIFDGANILPRDPATVSFDLTGKAKVLLDLMDPDEMARVEDGEMPAEVDSVSLNNLSIKAAGAEVSGSGAFTFDNTDLETFDGMPRPTGELNVAVNGANGLMDKLIQMGLLPEEQAMGARMMMSMFSVPGETEDSLKSKIEVNDQGHVLANGQRLR